MASGTPYNHRIWSVAHSSGEYNICMKHAVGGTRHDPDKYPMHNEHMRHILSNSYDRFAHSNDGSHRLEIWFENSAGDVISKKIKQIVLMLRGDTGHMKNFMVLCENHDQPVRAFSLDHGNLSARVLTL